MKKLMSGNLAKKILIIILIVLLFNFIIPNYSQADWGGVLFDPLVDLFAAIGDAVLGALQNFMYDSNVSLYGQGIFAMTIPNKGFEPSDFGMEADSGSINAQIYEENLDEVGWWNALTASSKNFNIFTVIGNMFSTSSIWGGIQQSAYDYIVDSSPYGIPIIRYTPEKIFSNQVPALDVNFINPKEWQGDTQDATDAMNDRSITQTLHNTVASWYVALRNLAILALLSVLLYVGIRIIISSTASDKAKYKQMLMDWVIALCILFFLHYLMTFILTLTETLTESIGEASTNIVVGIYDENGSLATNVNGTPLVYKSDLTGLCRLQVQSKELTTKLVYLIFYIALVIYTVMFTWTYVKRAITMAFLTLIAPVIAITYPIDKIKDGQAQAFNIWLKEFIFNALLQPFHLILFTIFLGSSMEIVVSNPVFAILFLAMIIPSEKLLRKMFGFDGSTTAGRMNSAASFLGGAALIKTASGLTNKLIKGGKGNNPATKNNLRTKENITDPNAPSLSSAFSTNRRAANTQNTRRLSARAVNQNTDNARRAQAIQSQQTRNRARMLENEKRARERARAARMNRATSPNRYRMANSSLANSVRNIPPQKPSRPIKGVLNAAGHVAKFAGKASLVGLGAATGAVLGVAAGITGDELEDVLTMGATGATIGAIGAPALGNVAANTVTHTIPAIGSGIRSAYERGAYGNYEAALREQTRAFMSNKANRQQISMNLQKELHREPTSHELNVAMQVAADYNNAGINDIKSINKAMKTENSIKVQLVGEGMSEHDASQAARAQSKVVTKMAGKLSNTDLRDKDQTKEIRKDIEKQLLKKIDMTSMNEEQKAQAKAEAKKQAKHILNLVKEQNGI